MLMRALVSLLAATPMLAQRSATAAVVSHDWRERNRAASELAAAPLLPVDELLAVLARDCDVPALVGGGRYGGRGRSTADDPAEQVLLEARRVLESFRPRLAPTDEQLTDAALLVVPWHPHDLATWLLGSRTSAHAEIARVLRSAPLRNLPAARLWLQVCQPDVDALLARDWNGSDLDAVITALWLDESRGRDLLAAALVRDDAGLRAAILRTGQNELFRSDAAIAVAVEAFGADHQRAAAAWLLTRDGRATKHLLSRLGANVESDRALLGLLCIVAKDRGEIGNAILPFLDAEDLVCQSRALVTVALSPVAASTRGPAARAAMEIVASRASLPVKLLAVDAIANLGEGVDDGMRRELARMLEEGRPAGARARLLGCLWRLGAVPTLTTQRKLEICTMYMATADTWRAVGEDGAAAAAALRDVIANTRGDTQAAASAARLAQAAPQSVVGWLDDESSRVRGVAIHALRSLSVDRVPTPRVAALCADADTYVARQALDWLLTRDDAPEQTVLAAMAATSTSWLPDTWVTFVRDRKPATAALLIGLAPMFARGEGLALLDARDPAVHAALHKWLAAASDTDVQWKLRLSLARDGFDGDLPEALRKEIEVAIDAGLTDRPDLAATMRALDARKALLSHAQRKTRR